MKKALTLAAAIAMSMAASSALAVELDDVTALEGDAEAGATVFRKCQACHVVEQEQNRVGPHLVNVIGRTAGTVDGFRYSPGMVEYGEAGNVWNTETLVPYLQNPRNVIKGGRMAFAGLKSAEELADVIAYLEQFSEEAPAE